MTTAVSELAQLLAAGLDDFVDPVVPSVDAIIGALVTLVAAGLYWLGRRRGRR